MKPNQNPDRYTEREAEWQIQSAPGITPLILKKGERPALIPVLKADGIVVELGGRYLISSGTLAQIGESPHWDIAENGRVLNRPMGRSLPIIRLNQDALTEIAAKRDISNLNAAVESVDYVFEGEKDSYGLPVGLIEQINYTIGEIDRPADTFRIRDLGLQADYKIEPFIIQTAQAEGTLDKAKLETFLKGFKERLKLINSDTNRIKGIFYKGESPSGLTYTITQRASTDTETTSSRTFIIKTSETIGVQATPISTATTLIAAVSASTAATASATLPPADAEVVARWKAWNWTAEEKIALKNGSRPDRERYLRWTPSMEQKGRVIGVLTFFVGLSSDRDRLREYFGVLPNASAYIEANKARKKSILETTRQLIDIEGRTGLTY